jgi:glycosyltransferase involved in cell wall biosynthesis
MTPTVSVVMRVYNAARHLREAVDCVLAQTLADFEIVAVDDGSTDDSPAILASYSDPRLRVVRQPNGGRNAAAIRGLSEACGRYVAILDADDRCVPERLAQQVAFLEGRPDAVLVGSDVGIIDEDGRQVGVRRYPRGDAALRRAAVVFNPFANSASMFRRDAALRVGGYDPGLMCEDYDLYLKLLTVGSGATLPAPLSDYRIRTEKVNFALVKAVLRGTIAGRSLAHRAYGFPRSLRSTAVDAAQRALILAPGSLVNWICERAFYRHA